MTVPGSGPGVLHIEAVRTVDAATASDLWALYRVAFESLRTQAASRHTLTRAEFDLEVIDERVTKYVAWRNGRPVGLVSLATDLTTIPWISPEFYAHRYPEHAARGALYYCSLALVHPDERLSDAFLRLVAVAAEDVAAADGVFAADMCSLNQDTFRLDRAVTALLTRAWGGVEPVELDRQVFLAWEPQSLARRAPSGLGPSPARAEGGLPPVPRPGRPSGLARRDRRVGRAA